jgi:putative ABC transport system permease protein
MTPHLLRLLAGRYLRQRWSRAALVVASIALGVSTLVSTRILNACLGAVAASSTTPLAGAADLTVSNGELGVGRAVADDLRAAKLPGVESVRPLVYERVSLPDLDDRPAVLLGAEAGFDAPAGDNPLGVTFTSTAEPTLAFAALAATRRPVVVSKPIHDAWTTRRPDSVAPFVLKSGTRRLDCLIVGYFDFAPDSPLKDLGRNVVGMDLGPAARFVRPGPPPAAAAAVGPTATGPAWDAFATARVNRVDVQLKPGADPEAARRAVQAVVGDRAAVRTPDAQGEATREIVGGIQIAFTLCSAGAMIVGLFLVYNAMAVTVAERRSDVGVLRSVGATRWQIVLLFGVMAVVLGVVGSLAGVPLGVGLARTVLASFRDELGSLFLSGDVAAGQLTPATVGLAVLAGTATAVFAALIPAIQAAGEDPAGAVRRRPGPAGVAWRVAHYGACLVLVLGGVALILARHRINGWVVPGTDFGLTRRFASFGGMMAALVGLLLAAPVIVGILVRLSHPLFRRFLPVEARLAADNMIRSPGRTGVVVGALGAGVAVMVQTAGVGMSNQVPVTRWLDEVVQADRFVAAGMLAESASSHAPMGPEVAGELARLPGVAGVVGVRYVRPEYNGTVVFVAALDADAYADLSAPRVPGGLKALGELRKLAGGDRVLVSDNFAVRHGVGPGGVLTLAGPRGPVRLDVVGTAKDYSWPRGTVIIDRSTYARLFGDDTADVVHVYLAAGNDGGAVARFADDRGLGVLDRPTMRAMIADTVDRINTLVFAQQIVVGAVAALGVVTALLISVLQRKRELGLLLAVGATPVQVIRSVFAEALLMGVYGTVLGVLIGLPLEWYILKVVLVEESGFVFDLLIPWRQAGLIAAGAMAAAALAGVVPARLAVRTRIPDAIAYE